MNRSQPTVLSANLSCFAAIFLWATGFIAAEKLFDSWGALAMLSTRMVISMTFLILWWGITENWKQIFLAPWKRGIGTGAVGWGVGSILLLVGQQLSDPVTTAIVVAMMPIAGAMTEAFFDGRRLTFRLVCGILLAVIGGYLATGVHLSDSDFSFGVILCLCAIFLFAWATRATTHNFQTLSATGQTTVTLAGGMLLILIFHALALVGDFGGTTIGHTDAEHLRALIIFALPSSAIAQLLWIWGARKLGILLASFHMNVLPFYVMVFAVILASAEWHSIQAIGAGLVALAVLISQTGVAPPGRAVDKF